MGDRNTVGRMARPELGLYYTGGGGVRRWGVGRWWEAGQMHKQAERELIKLLSTRAWSRRR